MQYVILATYNKEMQIYGTRLGKPFATYESASSARDRLNKEHPKVKFQVLSISTAEALLRVN